MATGLQTRHGNILQEAFKNGLQSFVNTTTNILAATSTAGTPAAGTFYSTVSGRASVTDISQDLKASFGIDRIMVQQIVQLQNEFGPNGEPVFSAVNDDRGLIRFVGSWTNLSDTYGTRPYPSASGSDYLEITFFGTALNILTYQNTANTSYSYQVDGSTAVSSSFLANTTLGNRNYAPNTVIGIVSGLSLGLHTVRLNSTGASNNFQIYGLEILNTNSTTSLNVNPGIAYADGLKIVSSAAQSIAYNSSFETGTLGTRGGHVVAYLKQDGTVGKAVTPVNAASAFLTSADHTNEEIVRTYNFREFSASRSDDFSQNFTASNQSATFTLDDGTTTLVGFNVAPLNTSGAIASGALALGLVTNGSFITITFVGTGLDITQQDASNGGADTYSISIDGGVGLSIPTSGNVNVRNVKVVSGLPYGTHTVRINRISAVTWGLGIAAFKVYQPKKPVIPTGAIELADYNVAATFAVNSAGTLSPSQGVIRKCSSREFTYVGTWVVAGVDTAFAGGFNINSATAGNYLEYTFFGTGVEYKGYLQASGTNYTFAIDGSTNLTGYTTSLYSPNIGTVTLNPSTGILSGTATGGVSYGSTVSITGLPLGLHKIRITLNNTTPLYGDTLDIITPIHSAKSNLNADIQNTLPVGSCALSDNRKTSASKDVAPLQKAYAQIYGITVSPSTSSTALVPFPDMNVTIKTKAGRIRVSFSVIVDPVGATGTFMLPLAVYVDGVQQGQAIYDGSGGMYINVSATVSVAVSEGVHTVALYWASPSGTSYSIAQYRYMLVEEV